MRREPIVGMDRIAEFIYERDAPIGGEGCKNEQKRGSLQSERLAPHNLIGTGLRERSFSCLLERIQQLAYRQLCRELFIAHIEFVFAMLESYKLQRAGKLL